MYGLNRLALNSYSEMVFNENLKEMTLDMAQRALINLARLLEKHKILSHDDIEILLEDLNPEFDDIYHEEMQTGTHEQPGVFVASKFKIEYDADVLELDATYAFDDVAIIVLRERQEDK